MEAGLLAGYSDFWDAVADLSEIDGDSLDEWPAVSDRVVAASSAIAAAAAGNLIDGTDPTVSTVAGIAAVDRLVAAAEESLAAWRAEDAAVAEANEAVRAERADLESYRAAGAAVLDGYVALRNDTGDFGDRIREDGVSYGPVLMPDHPGVGGLRRR